MRREALPHVLVMAKAPVPGRVKTRLCPPCTLADAAAIAEAALADTLDAVAGCREVRRVVALDGGAGAWLPAGFDVVPQRGADLAGRLTDAWARAGAPGIQIGMDTPQVTSELLDHVLDRLHKPCVDAVLGLADDGGWWVIGFRQPQPFAFTAIPTSTPRTGIRQLRRLLALGLRVDMVPTLRDLDTIEDAEAIAREVPTSRTAAAVQRARVTVLA